jgi:hypothetical protein
MAIIEAYTFTPQSVVATKTKNGGFDSSTNTLTPMAGVEVNEEWEMHVIMDNITLAAEAGLLDTQKFVSQIFASKLDFEFFLSQLSDYNESLTIYDRWWQALAYVASHGSDMEGCVTSDEIADCLHEAAATTGQV